MEILSDGNIRFIFIAIDPHDSRRGFKVQVKREGEDRLRGTFITLQLLHQTIDLRLISGIPTLTFRYFSTISSLSISLPIDSCQLRPYVRTVFSIERET